MDAMMSVMNIQEDEEDAVGGQMSGGTEERSERSCPRRSLCES